MKRIGFDLRALQIGHQYRGIGEVVRQVTSHLQHELTEKHEFVFFQYPDKKNKSDTMFHGDVVGSTVELPVSHKGKIAKYTDGGMTSDQEDIIRENCDIFVQYDFELGLPRSHKNILVIHDQIPYLLGNKYPHSYLAEYAYGRRAGLSKKDALKKDLQRRNYRKQLRDVAGRASTILTVSDYTAKTTKEFIGDDIPMVTMHLGHSVRLNGNTNATHSITPLEKAMNEEMGLKKDNFIFFLGGVDERRRVDDLVAAYNQVRASGEDIHLVLVGYDFQSIDTIYSPDTRRAIEQSSYKDQIHLYGYISDGLKAWLYENARAFVFPTLFEGFGIMLVESLEVGCPVISYSNSSLTELAGPNTFLVKDWYGIYEAILKLGAMPPSKRKELTKKGHEWASKFSWSQSAAVMADQIRKL